MDLPENKCFQLIDRVQNSIGYDKAVFLCALKKHLTVLDKFLLVESLKFRVRDDLIQTLISKFYIDKLEVLYPFPRFSCKVDENFAWPFVLYPSEVFPSGKVPDTFRIHNFFKSLKVADVLDCRVIGVYTSEYYFKVIHKYGSTRYLDDLNIIAAIPQSRKEMAFLKNGILVKDELIRAAVSEIRDCGNGKRMIKMTLDQDMWTRICGSAHVSNQGIKMGKIDKEDLPAYVLNPKGYGDCRNLKDYLLSLPVYDSPDNHDKLFTASGINVSKIYSFIPILNNLNREDRSEKLARLSETARKLVNKIVEKKKNGKQEKEDQKEIGEKQNKRATGNAGTLSGEWPGVNRLNLETVKSYAKACKKTNSIKGKEYASKIIYTAAIKFHKCQNYAAAYEAAEISIFANPNKDASALLDYLNKNYPNCMKKVEEPMETQETQIVPKIKEEPDLN